MAEKIILYAGTYTRPSPYLEATNGKGIYVYEFDVQSGKLSFASVTEHIDCPSYLAIDPKKQHLYATSEVWLWPEGRLTAFEIDPDSGALQYLNVQPTGGSITAYVSVDQTDGLALLVNYWSGSVAAFPLSDDGRLKPYRTFIQHVGTGPNPERQEGPHPHLIVADPTNRYAIVPDLGMDKVLVYAIDVEAQQLSPAPVSELALESGSGPRHFEFHPNGQYAYVIKELNSTISALAWDSANGRFELLQTVPALPSDFDGISHCADLHITPDGRFVYGSNRGHDSLVIYRIDADTGKLDYVGHQSTLGRTPRSFTIDPTGAYVLVANQDSDNVVVFRIDPNTGLLHETSVVDVPTPACLKMIAL